MLLDGVNHIAVFTTDSDRLHAFYRDVFNATVLRDQEVEEGARLSFVDIGGGRALHVFEGKGDTESQSPMSGRSRLDHIGLQAASLQAFDTIRERLIALGSTNGLVIDYGPALSLFFVDPDGLECRICVPNPNVQPGVFHSPGTPAVGYERVS